MDNIKGIEIHDIIGLSKPLEKLIDTVSKGLGTFYAPIGVKRMARAKANEMEIISEAFSNNIELPATYKDGKIEINTSDYKEIIERTGKRLLYQELRKQNNIDNVVCFANEELKEVTKVSDEPVDKDWVIRFFNSVEDVSSCEMQKIWAKILAGEVKQPDSFSLRTLDIVKNLTQREAQTFQKLSNIILISYDGSYKYIYSNTNLLNKYNLSYANILEMQECGLIKAQLLTLVNEQELTIYNEKMIGIIKSKSNKEQKISIKVYVLTEAGKQLYSIIYKDYSEPYFLEVLHEIKSKYHNFAITAHKIITFNDGEIEYDELNELQ